MLLFPHEGAREALKYAASPLAREIAGAVRGYVDTTRETPAVVVRADGSAVQWTYCTEPRPEMCTHHYDPVCGRRSEGDLHTYGNACTACSDSSVEAHRPGACE